MTVEIDEIVDGESFAGWLEGQPNEVAQILAARIALRSLPIVFSIQSVDHETLTGRIKRNLICHLFRVSFISWVARNYPTHDMSTAAHAATGAAHAAADAAYAAAADATTGVATGAVVYANSAARAAAYAARAAAYATGAATGAAHAATGAAHAAADAAAARAAEEDIWRTIRYECKILENGSVDDLISAPLWIREGNSRAVYESYVPSYVTDQLSSFRNTTEHRKLPWGLWLAWYEGLLQDPAHSRFGEKIDLEIALKPEEFWNRDARVVMDDLAQIVGWPFDEASDEVADDHNVLEQRPSAHSFEFTEGKIRATPLNVNLSSPDIAEELRGEVEQKARDLIDRLKRTQAPDRVLKTVERLQDALGKHISDVRSGILLSRTRSLEADVAQYDTDEARAEMAPDALSMLRDLMESVGDLKGAIPDIAEIEAARLALQLADGNVKRALTETNAIVDAAEYSVLVDQSSLTALRMTDPDIGEVNEIIETSTNDVVVADAIKQRAKLVSQKLLDVRNFTASILKPLQSESIRFLKDSGSNARKGTLTAIEKGTEKAVTGVVIGGLAMLVATFAGPFAGLAVLVASFTPLGNKVEEVRKAVDSEDKPVEPDAVEKPPED